MVRLRALLIAVLVASAPALVSPPAHASTRVEWKKVEVPAREDRDRVARLLRAALKGASRKADFGKKAKKIELSARVVELRWEQKQDVVRLSCTIVGRLEGGPSARSRISFGAAPKDRAKLEKQVLTMVANGVVTRLAEIVRSRS